MVMKKLTKTQLALVKRLDFIAMQLGRLEPDPPGPGVCRDMHREGVYSAQLSEHRWLREMLGLADES